MISLRRPARSPFGIAVSADGGMIYFSAGNHVGIVSQAGGNISWIGQFNDWPYADGNATTAEFSSLSGLAMDGSGNVVVADKLNQRLRLISPSGMVTTIAGTGNRGTTDGPAMSADLCDPEGVAVDTATGVIYFT